MHKTHKIALKPNNKHRGWFKQQCGYARFAYNQALADFKLGLDQDNFQSWQTLCANFNKSKKEYDWTQAQDQRSAKYAIENLGKGVSNWVAKRARFPRFKKRGKKDSFTTDEQSVVVRGKKIKLPKIGWIKMSEELRFRGKIVKVTVSRTAHKWFVSITVDVGTPKQVERSTDPIIGVDVGINTLATLDDGTKYDNPRPLKHYERKLKKSQRRLSKREYQSQNWYKQKLKVERLHYRITCIRNDSHHKASTGIVNRAGTIAIETLMVTNLLRNKRVAKALSDSALGGFLEKLKTKAETCGIPVVKADRFFASSKTCSSCGHKKKKLELSERTYHCSQCGISIDRDVNAALNLKQLAAGHAESLNACGADGRPDRTADRVETGKAVWQQIPLPI